MATKQLSYTAAQIDAAIAKINSLILHITANVVQLYDGSTAIYPRTQAEAVFFDGDPTKTLADYMWFIREGYMYKGFADFDVNPGIPTGNCFYLASRAGTYTYFKNTDEESIILEDDGIYALTYDKEELCWSYQILLNNFVYYIDNPEFVRVYLDNEGRILWGIQKDGTSVCGAGLKINEEFNLSGVISKVINNPEFLEVKLDAAGKIIWAIQKDGNILFGAGIPPQIKAELSQLEQELKDNLEQLKKKIEEELGYYINNPEYFKLLLDNEGKILEGIKEEGLKYIPIPIETNSAIISTIQNPEYLKVETDLEGKIINAIRRDGDCIVGGVNINELKRELDVNVIHIEYDPETYTIYSTENSNSTITLEFNNQTGDIFAIFDNRTVSDVVMNEYGDIFIILK